VRLSGIALEQFEFRESAFKGAQMNITEEHRKYMVTLFKSLANPVRLQILEHLRKRPWYVCELAVEIGIDKSIVSKYLLQMRQAGLVDYQKQGNQVEYRLLASCIARLADCALEEVIAYQNRFLDLPAEKVSCEA
jgi:ArsR family transcriptional regulator